VGGHFALARGLLAQRCARSDGVSVLYCYATHDVQPSNIERFL